MGVLDSDGSVGRVLASRVDDDLVVRCDETSEERRRYADTTSECQSSARYSGCLRDINPQCHLRIVWADAKSFSTSGVAHKSVSEARESFAEVVASFSPGARTLRNREGYRVRVGDYRIVEEVVPHHNLIKVLAVGHRRDVDR